MCSQIDCVLRYAFSSTLNDFCSLIGISTNKQSVVMTMVAEKDTATTALAVPGLPMAALRPLWLAIPRPLWLATLAKV